MPQTTVAGRRLSWREAGAGETLLLAHCSLAHSGLWKPVIAELARDFRVLAPDLPGHGASDPPPPGVSLQLYAVACMEALLAAEPAPHHLVGLSLGGAVLGRLALRRPERVGALVLIEPVFFHLLAGPRPEAWAANRALNAGMNAALAAGDLPGAARRFMEDWGMPGKFDAMDAEGQAYVARCLAHLAPDFPMTEGFPPGQVTEADLARLAVPPLLVAGETTQPAARAVVEVMEATIPGARLAIIPGAGHLSPVSHPAEVAALVRAEIAAARARGTGPLRETA